MPIIVETSNTSRIVLDSTHSALLPFKVFEVFGCLKLANRALKVCFAATVPVDRKPGVEMYSVAFFGV